MNEQPENISPLALIIEDNEDQNLVFAMALKKVGYSTESIYNGAEAQQRLKEVVPHVVVLDLHIPDVDGKVLLAQIRSDPNLTPARFMEYFKNFQFNFTLDNAKTAKEKIAAPTSAVSRIISLMRFSP